MYADLFHEYENLYSLPPGVLQAMAWQESKMDPEAQRYEPGFYARYIQDRPKDDLGGHWPSPGLMPEAEERAARATSYGLLQVMGQVARELGFVGISLHFALCDPETGVKFGAQHFSNKLKRYKDLGAALSAYNAGSPIASNVSSYVDPILARM